MPSGTLDEVDVRILEQLQGDARIPNVELAARVHLSPSPCLARVRRLERSGIIGRYVALLDAERVGLPVSVFIQVRLEEQVKRSLEVFEEAMSRRPEVMECYLMTGDSDYLLRVVVPDVAALERFIVDHLARVPGVANIRSSFALKQVTYQTALPVTESRAGSARATRARR